VHDGDIDLAKLPENSNYHTTGASLHPRLELLEYPRCGVDNMQSK
jgi:hypothetical protein